MVVPTLVEQETNVVDIYLVNPDEVMTGPKQNALEEKIDEEIEMEKLVTSHVKDIQDGPSRPTEEEEKVGGEQAAAQSTAPNGLLIWCPCPDGG